MNEEGYSESTKEKYDEFVKVRNQSLGPMRIKKLAEQAGYLPDSFGIGHWDMPEFQKFTELIVKECADIAVQNNEDKLSEDYNLGVGKAIKEHFGIEE